MMWILLLVPLWADPADDLPSEECAETAVTTEPQDAQGQSLYEAKCQNCHQANGSGIPGTYPPLTNSDFVNGDPRLIAHIILRGLSGEIYVNGERYASYMSAYGKDLSDKEVQHLTHYVQKTFGDPKQKEKLSLLKEEEIAAIRDAKLGRIKGMKGVQTLHEQLK